MSDRIDVKKLAQMARIGLSDERAVELEQDFVAILEMVGKLQEVDTSHVDARAYLTDVNNRFAEDIAQPATPEVHDRAIKSFTRAKGALLEVPGVFE